MTESYTPADHPPAIFDTNGPLHPNRIGAIGAGTQLGGFLIEGYLGTGNIAALSGMVAGGVADVADGKVARRWPQALKTLEGAKIDPLLDKVKTYMTALYVAAQGANAPVLASYAFNALVDYISTAQRGPVSDQVKTAIRAIINPAGCTIDTQVASSTRANWAGKAKTALQNVGGMALVGEDLIRESLLPYAGLELDSTVYQNANAVGLAVAGVLGAYGVYQKALVKKDA